MMSEYRGDLLSSVTNAEASPYPVIASFPFYHCKLPFPSLRAKRGNLIQKQPPRDCLGTEVPRNDTAHCVGLKPRTTTSLMDKQE